MQKSLFINNFTDWNEIQKNQAVMNELQCIVCGDYACTKRCMTALEMLEFNKELKKNCIQLYYISPKVTQALFEEEKEKVLLYLKNNIQVSINDWGLLYSIRDKIKDNEQVYLGRLLSKSIADWVWSDVFLAEESAEAVQYLYQNNFNEDTKMKLFQSYGVKGIEVSIHKQGEESYKAIQKNGFKIIGYVDDRIVAVSRSCPIRRNLIDNTGKCDCRITCQENYKIIPSDQKECSVYPELYVRGSTIYMKNQEKRRWNDYDQLVYYWEWNKEHLKCFA